MWKKWSRNILRIYSGICMNILGRLARKTIGITSFQSRYGIKLSIYNRSVTASVKFPLYLTSNYINVLSVVKSESVFC
jgi:hypothetical protein